MFELLKKEFKMEEKKTIPPKAVLQRVKNASPSVSAELLEKAEAFRKKIENALSKKGMVMAPEISADIVAMILSGEITSIDGIPEAWWNMMEEREFLGKVNLIVSSLKDMNIPINQLF